MSNASPLADRGEGSALPSGAGQAPPEGIVTIDESMHIVMVNPSAQRMFGHPAQQLLGRDLSVLLPAGLRDAHAAHARQFMASDVRERPMFDRGQLVGLRANGEAFPLAAAVCRMDVGGELGGKRYYTAVLRDLSHEQQLHALIDRLSRHMRSLFDLLPVAIWVTEGEAVVYANPACARLLGVAQREALVGQSIDRFQDPAVHDLVRQTVARALAEQETVFPLHGRIVRPDGASREVEMVVAALPDRSRTLVQMILSDITEQVQERRDLLDSRSTLRDLAASLVDAREEERRRIARELHDELGQRLMALKLALSALDRPDGPGIARERMQAMIGMVDDTVAATRRISMDLRPMLLDDLGLKAAIGWLAQEFERRAGLQIELRLDHLPEPLPQKVMITLYRTAQEALTNIVRHAGADHVVIAIARAASMVELQVDDNGRGFAQAPPQKPRGSFGLIGIHERVHMLGGQVSVGNRPQGGARLVVRLPLAEADAATPLSDDGAAPGATR